MLIDQLNVILVFVPIIESLIPYESGDLWLFGVLSIGLQFWLQVFRASQVIGRRAAGTPTFLDEALLLCYGFVKRARAGSEAHDMLRNNSRTRK